MKQLFLLLCCAALSFSASAQLVRLDRSRDDWTGGASTYTYVGDLEPIREIKGSQVVHVGIYLKGQLDADLSTVFSPEITYDYTHSYAGPYFREEYLYGAPIYIHGPPVIDFVNPISMVFTDPVEAFGVDIVHRFGPLPAVFQVGDVEILTFDSSGGLIGTIFSTATSGNYTDPSTWDFLSFETADRTASIKALTIYSTSGYFGIGPLVRFDVLAKASPVPEPSSYGFYGAAFACILVLTARRKRAGFYHVARPRHRLR